MIRSASIIYTAPNIDTNKHSGMLLYCPIIVVYINNGNNIAIVEKKIFLHTSFVVYELVHFIEQLKTVSEVKCWNI